MSLSDRSPIDVWRDTYQQVWFELKQDGRSPRQVIAGWGDCKPSTAGAWKRGDCTPDRETMMVLARNADDDGYPHFARLYHGQHSRLENREEIRVDGCLGDETRDISRILYEIQEAEKRGDARALHDLADQLHREAEEVEGEASLRSSDL